MSIKLYWSPVVLSQIDEPPPGSYRAKIRHKTGIRSIGMLIPCHGLYTDMGEVDRDTAGTPRHTHALCLVTSGDASFWSQVEADSDEVLLASFADGQTMFRRMKNATVGDVPTALRANWTMVLTQMNAETSDINLATPMIRVLRRLFYRINPLLKVWKEED